MNKFFLFFACLSLLWACESKTIQGRVVDPFGNPIEGVAVSIDKTMFTTTTNANGEYQLDYAPGVLLSVKWDKVSGNEEQVFDPLTEELSITEKCVYPLPEKTMWYFPSHLTKDERLGKLFLYREQSVEELQPISLNDHKTTNIVFSKVSRKAKYVVSYLKRRIAPPVQQQVEAMLLKELLRLTNKKEQLNKLEIKELYRNEGILAIELPQDDRLMNGDTVIFRVNKPHRFYAVAETFGVVIND